MQPYKGYLICTDIDGTLVNSQGVISENNIKAIKEFQQGGGLFTVSTGRMPEHVLGFPFIPNAPVISVNGTVIYDFENRTIIREFPMDCCYEDVLAYIDSTYANSIKGFEVYTPGEWEHFDAESVSVITKRFKTSKVYKLLFLFFDANDAVTMNRDLNEKFGDRFNFNRSGGVGLEMHKIGTGKGSGVKLLKEEMCPGIHTAVAIGDYENDITMREVADIGFAVGNAPDTVKRVADRIAPSNDEDAISYVINFLKESKDAF